LEKEIQMLLDYISLEMIRYGDRLDIKTDVRGELKNKFIAPLLMIPFVENAFKHGSSKLLKDPKVRLSIRVEDDNLFFELINNKPTDHDNLAKPNGKGGIGLRNAKKRLELLYSGQHQLKIESTESIFSVRMNIKIVKINNDDTINTPRHKKVPLASAPA
jgi:LytS/YehU family sensor histidine kinase